MGYQSMGVFHVGWHKVMQANSKLMLASRAFLSSLPLIKKTFHSELLQDENGKCKYL